MTAAVSRERLDLQPIYPGMRKHLRRRPAENGRCRIGDLIGHELRPLQGVEARIAARRKSGRLHLRVQRRECRVRGVKPQAAAPLDAHQAGFDDLDGCGECGAQHALGSNCIGKGLLAADAVQQGDDDGGLGASCAAQRRQQRGQVIRLDRQEDDVRASEAQCRPQVRGAHRPLQVEALILILNGQALPLEGVHLARPGQENDRLARFRQPSAHVAADSPAADDQVAQIRRPRRRRSYRRWLRAPRRSRNGSSELPPLRPWRRMTRVPRAFIS